MSLLDELNKVSTFTNSLATPIADISKSTATIQNALKGIQPSQPSQINSTSNAVVQDQSDDKWTQLGKMIKENIVILILGIVFVIIMIALAKKYGG